MTVHSDSLQRFLDAQAGVYQDALAELARGRKTSHWMWFIFPQLKGLGHSETARYFGIASREEARAYLEHPVLGTRLRQCVDRIMALDSPDPHAIFGSPDDLKLRSSLTLFAAVAGEDKRFEAALDHLYPEGRDKATLAMLGG